MLCMKYFLNLWFKKKIVIKVCLRNFISWKFFMMVIYFYFIFLIGKGHVFFIFIFHFIPFHCHGQMKYD